jgi:hypothetical protein
MTGHDLGCTIAVDPTGLVVGAHHAHPPWQHCRLDPLVAGAASATPVPPASGPVAPPDGPPVDPANPPSPPSAPTVPGTGTPDTSRAGTGTSPEPDATAQRAG